jgi:hypothetical protein
VNKIYVLIEVNMDKEKKNNIVDFKPKDNSIENDPYIYEDDEIETYSSQYFELPLDFIKTEKNIDIILTLMGVYRLMGLDEEAVLNASYMFADVFGDIIGLVPERHFEDD